MEKFWYVAGGVILGLVICYFWPKDGGGEGLVFKCGDNEVLVQYCTDKTKVDFGPVSSIDSDMIAEYQKAVLSGNDVGFSLDKDLIMELEAYLFNNPSSSGIRIYPGIDNAGNKNVLVKPFDNTGKEIQNVGKIYNIPTIMDLRGPCPNWCDNVSRIIQ
jgi:hypothetical protein